MWKSNLLWKHWNKNGSFCWLVFFSWFLLSFLRWTLRRAARIWVRWVLPPTNTCTGSERREVEKSEKKKTQMQNYGNVSACIDLERGSFSQQRRSGSVCAVCAESKSSERVKRLSRESTLWQDCWPTLHASPVDSTFNLTSTPVSHLLRL